MISITIDALVKLLSTLDACSEAREWVRGQPSPLAAWESCPRGDWLLWIAERRGVDRKLLTCAACACARTALKYVPPGELRPLRAIEAAEAWARGEATLDEVAAARIAAWAAAWAAASAAARAAAWAAASAAARAAARAAASAAARATAWAAASAAARATAWAAAWAAARTAASAVTLSDCADLVRAVIRFEDLH